MPHSVHSAALFFTVLPRPFFIGVGLVTVALAMPFFIGVGLVTVALARSHYGLLQAVRQLASSRSLCCPGVSKSQENPLGVEICGLVWLQSSSPQLHVYTVVLAHVVLPSRRVVLPHIQTSTVYS